MYVCIYLTPPLNAILFCVILKKYICYHPCMVTRCFAKMVCGSGFVNMSAYWLSVLMWCILTCWELTYERKWWYLMSICFVRGRYLCLRAISNAPTLSSKTLQWMLVCGDVRIRFCVAISSSRCIMGLASLKAQLSPMYSDSVLLSAMWGCSWLFQHMGQPAYVMQ